MEVDGRTRIFQAVVGFQSPEVTEKYPKQGSPVTAKDASAVLNRMDYRGYTYSKRWTQGYRMLSQADETRKSDLTIETTNWPKKMKGSPEGYQRLAQVIERQVGPGKTIVMF